MIKVTVLVYKNGTIITLSTRDLGNFPEMDDSDPLTKTLFDQIVNLTFFLLHAHEFVKTASISQPSTSKSNDFDSKTFFKLRIG